MAGSEKEGKILTNKIGNMLVSNMPNNIPDTNSMPGNNMPANNNSVNNNIANNGTSSDETPKSHNLPDEHCCKYCMKFDQFGDKCHIFWEKKKFCTMKVTNATQWNDERSLLGI